MVATDAGGPVHVKATLNLVGTENLNPAKPRWTFPPQLR
jgi:hypothetical protein